MNVCVILSSLSPAAFKLDACQAKLSNNTGKELHNFDNKLHYSHIGVQLLQQFFSWIYLNWRVKKQLQDNLIQSHRVFDWKDYIYNFRIMVFVGNKIHLTYIYDKISVSGILPEKSEIAVLYLLQIFHGNRFFIFTSSFPDILQQSFRT